MAHRRWSSHWNFSVGIGIAVARGCPVAATQNLKGMKQTTVHMQVSAEATRPTDIAPA